MQAGGSQCSRPPPPSSWASIPHSSVFAEPLLSLEHEKFSSEVLTVLHGRVGAVGLSAVRAGLDHPGSLSKCPAIWIEALAGASWADGIYQRGSWAVSGQGATDHSGIGRPSGHGILRDKQTSRLGGPEASVCPSGGPGHGPESLSSCPCPVPTEALVS